MYQLQLAYDSSPRRDSHISPNWLLRQTFGTCGHGVGPRSSIGRKLTSADMLMTASAQIAAVAVSIPCTTHLFYTNYAMFAKHSQNIL